MKFSVDFDEGKLTKDQEDCDAITIDWENGDIDITKSSFAAMAKYKVSATTPEAARKSQTLATGSMDSVPTVAYLTMNPNQSDE